MSLQIVELDGLVVRVDEVIYSPERDAPEDRPHPFVYHITIANGSPVAVTIRARKWVLTGTSGSKQVIEGEGVVGESPRIEPGEGFQYSSYHVVAEDTQVQGSYLGILDDNTPVITRIPKFTLRIPADR